MIMEKRIIFRYLGEKEIDDLDFKVSEDLGLSEDEYFDRGKDITIPEEGNIYSCAGQTESIKIEDFISLLEEFKKMGATHTEIMHHVDHRGFVFNPLEIKVATKKELKEIEKVEKETEKKRLLKELDEIKVLNEEKRKSLLEKLEKIQ